MPILLFFKLLHKDKDKPRLLKFNSHQTHPLSHSLAIHTDLVALGEFCGNSRGSSILTCQKAPV